MSNGMSQNEYINLGLHDQKLTYLKGELVCKTSDDIYFLRIEFQDIHLYIVLFITAPTFVIIIILKVEKMVTLF